MHATTQPLIRITAPWVTRIHGTCVRYESGQLHGLSDDSNPLCYGSNSHGTSDRNASCLVDTCRICSESQGLRRVSRSFQQFDNNLMNFEGKVILRNRTTPYPRRLLSSVIRLGLCAASSLFPSHSFVQQSGKSYKKDCSRATIGWAQSTLLIGVNVGTDTFLKAFVRAHRIEFKQTKRHILRHLKR